MFYMMVQLAQVKEFPFVWNVQSFSFRKFFLAKGRLKCNNEVDL